MQQIVTRFAAITVPPATPPEAAHVPLAVGTWVSMTLYWLDAATLTAEQVSGTAMLMGEPHEGSADRAAPPALHFPTAFPQVHALQPRVSANIVPITILLLV
jgi:hypothetical protein